MMEMLLPSVRKFSDKTGAGACETVSGVNEIFFQCVVSPGNRTISVFSIGEPLTSSVSDVLLRNSQVGQLRISYAVDDSGSA